jgi:site-specific DNA recombinase
VVLDIFTRYARGEGFKTIAHSLNAQGVVAPRPQRNRPTGWEPSTVRAVLKRSLYRGTVEWNRTRKRDDDGSRHKGRQPKRPESEWISVEKPELRIVSEALAHEVDERLGARRTAFLRDHRGHLLGRPVDGKHLLAGFLQCTCGATFEARRGYYVCSARRRRGPSVCGNEITMAVEDIEKTFLDVIEGEVLHPDFIDRVIEAALAVEPDVERDVLTRERAGLLGEIGNLTAGIAAGGNIPALAVALQERDKRLRTLDAALSKPAPAVPQRDALRAALRLRGADWREVLRGPHIAQARQVLQHLITLPIRVLGPAPAFVTPGDLRGHWEASTRPGGLLVGLVQSVASPSSPSWNQITSFLESMRRLRDVLAPAA